MEICKSLIILAHQIFQFQWQRFSGRKIKVPVSLTYDASGVKVEQISTWVGLGSNLNIGGMVTRQVNGQPDDGVGGTEYIPFYSKVDYFPEYYKYDRVARLVALRDLDKDLLETTEYHY